MCQVRCYNHSGEKFLRINALTWPLWFSEYYTEFLIECTYELYGGAIKICLSDGSTRIHETFNSFLLCRLWEFRNPKPISNPARYYLEFRLNEDSVFGLSVFLNCVCLFFSFSRVYLMFLQRELLRTNRNAISHIGSILEGVIFR